ncbi:hypothetical protein OU787_00910 [Kitasatospora sp. YST-16]|uniref:hypothetical protein n=1 Tax=Kitasatospora sp. YST-16 TaxID=2998080 RepID=UPI002283DD8C|nr:hypothetical protein [Kitasatospora sp. YST-16]WAL70175.1 hypothetical protein OU787_00910 [Kitasatospora sp. YST-16]WNW36217.1 hypothetical protein RKE32_00925 [Streptomyces sp. Li-HN-5-13]
MTVVPLDPASPASHAVGIDFDQTLVAHDDGWQDGRIYGKPVPGAIESLHALKKVRSVFIMTARPRRFHAAVAGWLREHSGLETLVDEDPERAYWQGDCLLVTNKKLGAAVYIDDRAIRFTGDWTATLTQAHHAIGLPAAATDPATVTRPAAATTDRPARTTPADLARHFPDRC